MPLPKIDWTSVWAWMIAHKKVLLIVGLAIVLVFLFFFISDRLGDYFADRKIQKQKEAIANKVDQIQEKKAELAVDQAEVDRLTGEVKVETQQLAEDLAVREELRKETNQAIANLEAVKNAPPSNVDRTAEDLKKLLDKLEENQR